MSTTRILTAIVVLACLGLCAGLSAAQDDSGASKVYVKMTTTQGDIILQLDRDKAPITVDNFLQYVDDGFYDGTIFHRVISTFMIQGGGFEPGLTKKETRAPIKNEWDNGLINLRGTIAMARTNIPDSATSQFFINVVDNQRLSAPQRDGTGYCVFGKVLGSMDAVDGIRRQPVTNQVGTDGNNYQNVPVEEQIIQSVERIDASEISDLVAAETKREEMLEMAQTDAKGAAMKLLETKGVATSDARETDSGLVIIDAEAGDGSEAQQTDTVTVHYSGWLPNGTMFDSSHRRSSPATFSLQGVIKGWTEGVSGMKPGGKRYLIIPPDLGYGDRGSPPLIPPGSYLVFEVDLLSIN